MVIRETDHESIMDRLCRLIESIPFVVLDALLYLIYFIALSLLAIIGLATKAGNFVKRLLFIFYPKS